jgi:hypothetical protein
MVNYTRTLRFVYTCDFAVQVWHCVFALIKLVTSELVEFLSLSNPMELCSNNFPSWFHRPGGINKDPTAWLVGARPPDTYIFKNNISWPNSKI